jgi:hypothetical protein
MFLEDMILGTSNQLESLKNDDPQEGTQLQRCTDKWVYVQEAVRAF